MLTFQLHSILLDCLINEYLLEKLYTLAVCTTVWKFTDFSAPQILREINLSEWKKEDVNCMTIFEILNLLKLISRRILGARKITKSIHCGNSMCHSHCIHLLLSNKASKKDNKNLDEMHNLQ